VTDTAATVCFNDLPPLGGDLHGGRFAGLVTDKTGQHFAVALLPDKPESELTFKKAVTWAESIGGVLPSRPISALLFANAKDQFDAEWHWTSEPDGSYAWFQYFYCGSQISCRQYNELRARAVRLIQLTA
jgi:hypothetical protein